MNVEGAVAVFGAALDAKVRRFVHVSSAAVYSGTRSAAPLEEDRPLFPDDVYGVSKHAAEQALLHIAAERGGSMVIARLGAVFGPWERLSGVRDTMSPIWQVTGLAQRGEAAVLPRPGRKDWLYSRDAAAALVALLDCESPPRRIYNVGGGVEWTVAAWCELLVQRYPKFRFRVGGTAANVNFHGDDDRPPLGLARITEDIGFRPRFGLNEALADYLGWLDSEGGASALSPAG